MWASESAEDATCCGDWRYCDGIVDVSVRTQEKTRSKQRSPTTAAQNAAHSVHNTSNWTRTFRRSSWPDLPATLKAGILAMVESCTDP